MDGNGGGGEGPEVGGNQGLEKNLKPSLKINAFSTAFSFKYGSFKLRLHVSRFLPEGFSAGERDFCGQNVLHLRLFGRRQDSSFDGKHFRLRRRKFGGKRNAQAES